LQAARAALCGRTAMIGDAFADILTAEFVK